MEDRFEIIKQRYENPKDMMKSIGYSTIYKAIVEDIPWLIMTLENSHRFEREFMRTSVNWASIR